MKHVLWTVGGVAAGVALYGLLAVVVFDRAIDLSSIGATAILISALAGTVMIAAGQIATRRRARYSPEHDDR